MWEQKWLNKWNNEAGNAQWAQQWVLNIERAQGELIRQLLTVPLCKEAFFAAMASKVVGKNGKFSVDVRPLFCFFLLGCPEQFLRGEKGKLGNIQGGVTTLS